MYFQVGCGDLSSSWAGGVDGRQVIDQFLPYVTELLSPSGVLYLVVIKENKPGMIVAKGGGGGGRGHGICGFREIKYKWRVLTVDGLWVN